jgi:hypothetical protein
MARGMTNHRGLVVIMLAVFSAFAYHNDVKSYLGIERGGRFTGQFTARPQALIDDDLEDYGELNLPEWLSKVVDCEDDEEESDCTARLEAAAADAASKFSSYGADYSNAALPKFLPKHSLMDLVAISHLYSADFGIVMYDPENDDFLLLYNGEKTWVGPILKLALTFRMLAFMLRKSFPDRFRGKESDELGECAFILLS